MLAAAGFSDCIFAAQGHECIVLEALGEFVGVLSFDCRFFCSITMARAVPNGICHIYEFSLCVSPGPSASVCRVHMAGQRCRDFGRDILHVCSCPNLHPLPARVSGIIHRHAASHNAAVHRFMRFSGQFHSPDLQSDGVLRLNRQL